MHNNAEILAEIRTKVEKNRHMRPILISMTDDDWLYMRELLMRMDVLKVSEVERIARHCFIDTPNAGLAKLILNTYIRTEIEV